MICEVTGACDLLQILRMCIHQKKKFKIIRADKQGSPGLYEFWFSAMHNIHTNIFSVEDLSSYWLILESGEDR